MIQVILKYMLEMI